MRLKAPRIAPLSNEEMSDEQKEMMGERFDRNAIFNVFRTIARAPKAYKAFMHWGGYILSRRNDLSARDRELVILRAGYNWKAGYEWAQHVVIGKEAGLTDEEVERIKAGPDADGWSAIDAAMLQATDELTSDAFITDATWARLSDLTDKQKMDLVMTVGQYTQVSMMLNSFGVQLDEGLTLDPDLDGRR
jgi:4-carboxymuconolactone decarboxylase